MQFEGIFPNKVTFICILEACSMGASLAEGEKIHKWISKSGFEVDLNVGTALIKMYLHYGKLQDSLNLFDKLPDQDVVAWSAIIAGFAEQGLAKEAIHFFSQMQEEGVMPNKITFICVLDACGSLGCIQPCQQMHARIIKIFPSLDIVLGNALISMYKNCSSLECAQGVFDEMSDRDIESWKSLIELHAQSEQKLKALQLVHQMLLEGVIPDKFTFVYVLIACASQALLWRGKLIHASSVGFGLDSNVYVLTALINMYSKCGSLQNAQKIFNEIIDQNVVSYTSMITAYVQHFQSREALQLFDLMRQKGICPNSVTYMSVFDACATVSQLAEGKKLHACVQGSGLEVGTVGNNAIIHMYGKCGNLKYAQEVFNYMTVRDVVSWTAMIRGFVEQGQGKMALLLFTQMQEEGITANKVTYVCVLEACTSFAALLKGMQLHGFLLEVGLELDINVGTALLNMYGKCGSLPDARCVFTKLPQRDEITWNAMITASAQHGEMQEALGLIIRMEESRLKPNKVTFLSVVDACAAGGVLFEGRKFHNLLLIDGLELHTVVGNALINMYGKCHFLQDAWKIFLTMLDRDVVSWNTMISVCAEHEHVQEALQLFYHMQSEFLMPNNITYASILDLCASCLAISQGEIVYHAVVENQFDVDTIVKTAVVDMYGKCGYVEAAQTVFDRIAEKNVVSWTAIMSMHVQHGECMTALHLFEQMQKEGIKANKVTLVSVLDACASCAALAEGKQIAIHIADNCFMSDDAVAAALLNMYAKCGSLGDAWRIFNQLSVRTVVIWTTMIMAHAQHGLAIYALRLLNQMQGEGVMPDKVTFLSVLAACSHAGLVSESIGCFALMSLNHGIFPSSDHYACLVDLLGRAGRLEDAENLLKYMPIQPSLASHMALLGSCRYHGHLQLGEFAAEHLFELDSVRTAPHIMLSHIYATTTNQHSTSRMRCHTLVAEQSDLFFIGANVSTNEIFEDD